VITYFAKIIYHFFNVYELKTHYVIHACLSNCNVSGTHITYWMDKTNAFVNFNLRHSHGIMLSSWGVRHDCFFTNREEHSMIVKNKRIRCMLIMLCMSFMLLFMLCMLCMFPTSCSADITIICRNKSYILKNIQWTV
jgi:hypothetical protein